VRPGDVVNHSASLLRRQVDFRRYWTGQTLSAFGSSLTALVVPLLVLQATHQPALAGAFAMVRLVVLNVARLPGGVLADRWSRRAVLVGVDAGKAVLWTVPAVLLFGGWHHVWIMLLIFGLDGALSAVYNPAAAAILNRVVAAQHMTRALSLNQARSQAAGLVGPVVGGGLFAVSPWLPLAVDAATFLACAVLTARIRADLGGRAASAGWREDGRAGLRYLYRQPFLMVLATWSALLNFATAGAFFGLTPVLAQAGTAPTAIGAISAVVSAGALIGALLAPRLAAKRTFAVLVVTGFLAVILVGLAALVPLPPVIAAALGLLATAGPVLSVVLNARVYRLVPDALMGRVQSALLFVGSMLYPFGPFVVGWLLQVYGNATAYAAMAVCLAGCAALSVARPIREELGAPPNEKERS
jgi:MFS family permease